MLTTNNLWCKSINLSLSLSILSTSLSPGLVAAQSAVPGVPATPTSSIVNDVTMRPAKSGTVNLFSGTNLTGWTGNSAWSVQDGALTGGNGGVLNANSYLRSAASYKNFELRAKVKAPPQGNLNKGGIEFLSTQFTDADQVVRTVNYQWDAGSGY